MKENFSLLNNEKNPIIILFTKINLANAIDHNKFSNSTEFNIKKPETYVRVMQGLYTAECAQAMKEKFDQFYKNKMWTIIHQDKIKISYRTLKNK